MDYEKPASQVATLLATEAPGTKVVVWDDGDVTRTCTVTNPTVGAGVARQPVAFFVSGIDRPRVGDIVLRLERAFSSQLRPAS